MRFRLVSILAVGALLVAAAVALAVKPKGSYMFTAPLVAHHPNVSFTTTQNGKKLVAFQAEEILICKTSTCGGFGGLKGFTRSSVRVRNGKFKVSGPVESVTGKKLGTQTVTGKFVSPTKVKGKVTTSNLTGFTNQYHGGTESYTAKGVPATLAGT